VGGKVECCLSVSQDPRTKSVCEMHTDPACLCRGPYPSEMTAAQPLAWGTGQIPQGRMGSANDIAGLTLFLVGRGGAYVNGSVQLTDGGRLGVLPAVY
jgi:THO complex subunit 3